MESINNKNLYCKKCNDHIVFLHTTNNKLIPVNYDSLSNNDITEMFFKYRSVNFRFGEHISHFATCPFSSSFRKKI